MIREMWESRFRGATLLCAPLGWDAFGKDYSNLPYFETVAQRSEQRPYKASVVGSSPISLTMVR